MIAGNELNNETALERPIGGAEQELLSDDQARALTQALPEGWRVESRQLVKDFKFSDFAAALAFVNQVGGVAESLNHHPDILLHSWNRVRLSLWTHTINGVSERDFILAAKIDGDGGMA